MKYFIIILVLFSTSTSSIFADDSKMFDDKVMPMKHIQVSGIDSSGKLDTFRTYPDEFLDDIFTVKMDSMMTNWFVKNAYNIDSMVIPDTTMTNLLILDEEFNNEISGKAISDSIYIERLAALNSYVDLSFNKTVRNTISLYTDRRRNQVETMLGLANYYFPMFEEILDKYELPLELKYMAIIESALNSRAYSRAGACGLWQFVYGTGKMYNLEITTYVDERKDPAKSTEAAAQYLSDLYKIYNDWHLVIAAYNCGPGNVNKAIRRSGGKRDYWTIYYRLPRETRGYVPAFIAATYVMNYYKLHNLSPRQSSYNVVTDTLMVSNYLNFEQISSVLGIDIELLRDLNSMYRLDIIPATANKPYALRLPQEYVSKFIDFEQRIFAYKHEEYFPNNKIKNPSSSAYHYVPVEVKGKDKVFYKVKSGDNVGFISEWFKVRASDLRYWNNIRGNMIRVGQKLVIYVGKGKGDSFGKFDSMSFAEKQKANGSKTVQKSANIATNQPIDNNYVYYKVRRGDNLWSIAKQYPGISADNILALNNIPNSKGLNIGQLLRIMKK